MGLIWITGLPGVGKSTVARALVDRLRNVGEQALLLDGDTLRETLAPLAGGYDENARRRLAQTYANLAALVSAQGSTVVTATVSLFAELHAANRTRFARYLEVLLECEEGERQRRRPPATMEGPRHGDAIVAELPAAPHLVLATDAAIADELADRIFRRWRRMDG
jgi:adenylylsulfate kinase-like enzyme